jgi:hypothetical protein
MLLELIKHIARGNCTKITKPIKTSFYNAITVQYALLHGDIKDIIYNGLL